MIINLLGLRVLLYADISEYLPTSESVGFRITVHDKWLIPFPDAFGYNAPTGFLSSFGVRMKKFNRIVPPHGQCLEDSGRDLDTIYPGFNYSAEGCHRTCTQKEVIRICGCANPAYPVPHKAAACKVTDPTARQCIKNATFHLNRLITEGNSTNCVCHQPCSEVNYEVTYSAARWPSGTTKVMECDAVDDLCMERYRKNAAMVQVFYEELNYEILTETPAYTLTSALADLGGLTGLWIGASVVSLMEIVALIVYTVQAYVRKRKSSSIKQLSHPSVYPRYTKRSLSSSLSTLSSSRVKIAKIKKIPSKLEISKESLRSEEEQEKPEEIKQVHKKSKYLPPGVELPCECIYENGKIQLMNALCPEHGYMVRRKENSGLFFKIPGYSDSQDQEEYEQEQENEDISRSDKEIMVEQGQDTESSDSSSDNQNN